MEHYDPWGAPDVIPFCRLGGRRYVRLSVCKVWFLGWQFYPSHRWLMLFLIPGICIELKW